MFSYKNSYGFDENINVFLTDIYLQYIFLFQKKPLYLPLTWVIQEVLTFKVQHTQLFLSNSSHRKVTRFIIYPLHEIYQVQ